MAEETPDDPTAEDDGPKQGVGGYLYRLALAGVGAVMLAQEELEARFKRRVETPSQEGEPLPVGKVPSDDASISDEALVGPSDDEGEGEGDEGDSDGDEDGEKKGVFFSQIDATVASFIHKLVPSRAEIDALTQEIDALAAEVEALKQG